MVGRHPIFAGASTQTIISLSSGEAEFYGMVRGACRLLGLISLCADLNWTVKGTLVTDSSAAKGMASRRGAATVRHIHCPALWLQHAIADRKFKIEKRDGRILSADVGTKPGIPANKLWELLTTFGIRRATEPGAGQLGIDQLERRYVLDAHCQPPRQTQQAVERHDTHMQLAMLPPNRPGNAVISIYI